MRTGRTASTSRPGVAADRLATARPFPRRGARAPSRQRAWYNALPDAGRGQKLDQAEDRDTMGESLTTQGERICPWCGSSRTILVARGYTGATDEVDQYFTCSSCGKVTYELVAKTAREMRLGRFRAGGVYQDRANRTRYQVSRVLKVGINEYLVYLKPIIAPAAAPAGSSAM
jgi:hypothetical protein